MSQIANAKQGKNSHGLTAASVTQNAEGLTSEDVTALMPARKRSYKPRARKCKGCGKSFTPQSKMARYCSNACRSRIWRRKHPKPKVATLPELEPVVCEGCGLPFLANASKRQKYHSPSCRVIAARARREAAISAIAAHYRMKPEKAADGVEMHGMKKITALLTKLGFRYEPSARRWLVPDELSRRATA